MRMLRSTGLKTVQQPVHRATPSNIRARVTSTYQTRIVPRRLRTYARVYRRRRVTRGLRRQLALTRPDLIERRALVHSATDQHVAHRVRVADVGQRVGIEHHEIGELSRLDAAEVAVEAGASAPISVATRRA